jgi:acetylornithine deacetylase/succinyl-diaminopimelate desuccinylase-like protein
MWLAFDGRSVHASVPEKGENPNYALAEFLERLQKAKGDLSRHPYLGPTTVSPTVIEVDTKSPNVTPAWTRVLLDFRTASESTDSLQAFVRRLAGDWPHTITNAWTNEPFPPSDELVYGFYTPPESEIVQRIRAALTKEIGDLGLTNYQFATDGRHFVPFGIPVIGFSPAEENQAHIAGESISIAAMGDSLRGHVQLLREF